MMATFCCFWGEVETVSPVVDERLISGDDETAIAPETAASEEYRLVGTEAGCKVDEPVW